MTITFPAANDAALSIIRKTPALEYEWVQYQAASPAQRKSMKKSMELDAVLHLMDCITVMHMTDLTDTAMTANVIPCITQLSAKQTLVAVVLVTDRGPNVSVEHLTTVSQKTIFFPLRVTAAPPGLLIGIGGEHLRKLYRSDALLF